MVIIMWIIMAAVAVLLGIYVYVFFRRVFRFYSKGKTNKVLQVFQTILAVAAGVFSVNIWNGISVILLHLIFSAMLFDLAAIILRKIFAGKKEKTYYRIAHILYHCGLIPVITVFFILLYGFLNMENIVRTEYTVQTTKDISDYKVVLITDTHYATIQDTDILKDSISEINAQNPDIVILGGDIVEEGTSHEKMQEVFEIFQKIKSNYGVFYVYGNHDRQPYTDKRTYTDKELTEAITKNGIVILEDTFVEINEELILAGRGDAAWGNDSGRASAEELLEKADMKKYIIVADHQPVEAAENNAAGVDLELSGHTHAGQIWPTEYFFDVMKMLRYGRYQEGDCTVIVSSGFAGWQYPIRTQEHCEYVVINIQGTKKQ